MASNGNTLALTITAEEARNLTPHIRHAYRALSGITSMHQAAGLKRQALQANLAARRLLILCGQLDALTR